MLLLKQRLLWLKWLVFPWWPRIWSCNIESSFCKSVLLKLKSTEVILCSISGYSALNSFEQQGSDKEKQLRNIWRYMCAQVSQQGSTEGKDNPKRTSLVTTQVRAESSPPKITTDDCTRNWKLIGSVQAGWLSLLLTIGGGLGTSWRS